MRFPKVRTASAFPPAVALVVTLIVLPPEALTVPKFCVVVVAAVLEPVKVRLPL